MYPVVSLEGTNREEGRMPGTDLHESHWRPLSCPLTVSTLETFTQGPTVQERPEIRLGTIGTVQPSRIHLEVYRVEVAQPARELQSLETYSRTGVHKTG